MVSVDVGTGVFLVLISLFSAVTAVGILAITPKRLRPRSLISFAGRDKTNRRCSVSQIGPNLASGDPLTGTRPHDEASNCKTMADFPQCWRGGKTGTTELTTLELDWLISGPSLYIFLDQLRERRHLPEPKNYKAGATGFQTLREKQRTAHIRKTGPWRPGKPIALSGDRTQKVRRLSCLRT